MWSLVVPLGLAGGAAGEPSVPPPIAVVVGKTSPIRDVTLDTLRDVYLRRQRLWPDGRRAMPVNLPADSPYRLVFSQRVLGRLPGQLIEYWNRLYFDGIRPPLVLRSAEAIHAYLATEPSALAYLPADAVDVTTCRVVLVLE